MDRWLIVETSDRDKRLTTILVGIALTCVAVAVITSVFYVRGAATAASPVASVSLPPDFSVATLYKDAFAEQRARASFPLVIEFGDYECPGCRETHTRLSRLTRSSSVPLQVVFRHFPLKMHKRAFPAALVAEAAAMQGKFPEMHDYLFHHAGEVSQQEWQEYARSLGMQVSRMNKDIKSRALANVQRDIALGRTLKIQAVPTLLLCEQGNPPRATTIGELEVAFQNPPAHESGVKQSCSETDTCTGKTR